MKRDIIRDIEKKVQQRWEREKIFELDAPKVRRTIPIHRDRRVFARSAEYFNIFYFILFYFIIIIFLVCLLSRKAVVLEYIRYLHGYNAYTQIGIAAINKCKNLPSAVYMHLLSTESQ